MKKRVALPLIWLAAAALASTVAWQGVQIVSSQVLETEPTDLASQATTSTSTSTPSTPAVQEQQAVGSGSTTSAATASQSTTDPGGTSSQSTSSTTPGTDSQPTSSAQTATTAEQTDQTVTQTFVLTGGTTAISFSPAGVTVIYANANDGFSAKIQPEGAGIKVEFESDYHKSRVEAWWYDGPRNEIRERPE